MDLHILFEIRKGLIGADFFLSFFCVEILGYLLLVNSLDQQ